MKERAIYPGTFDPLTNGHEDLVRRAARLFDTVIVGVSANPGKSPMFTVEERVYLAKTVLQDLNNVKVYSYTGLTVDLAMDCKARVILRGLRAISDFESEFQMANITRHLNSNFEIIFLTAKEQHTLISSSAVRELTKYGGDVSRYVSPVVVQALSSKKLNPFIKIGDPA